MILSRELFYPVERNAGGWPLVALVVACHCQEGESLSRASGTLESVVNLGNRNPRVRHDSRSMGNCAELRRTSR